jgi:hypothetical protein
MEWEYHVEEKNLAERWTPKRQAEELAALSVRINELGAQGWELVSYEPVPLYGALPRLKGHAYLLFFKRPRSS